MGNSCRVILPRTAVNAVQVSYAIGLPGLAGASDHVLQSLLLSRRELAWELERLLGDA